MPSMRSAATAGVSSATNAVGSPLSILTHTVDGNGQRGPRERPRKRLGPPNRSALQGGRPARAVASARRVVGYLCKLEPVAISSILKGSLDSHALVRDRGVAPISQGEPTRLSAPGAFGRGWAGWCPTFRRASRVPSGLPILPLECDRKPGR
ncbi:hypothetical protein MAPG_02146 [Magnaporthiopsis poae ATCC 64411]|uniref:Uncharacterized protein n=1 Tax=Magnaporthiopsis poae (strain ATCC 64411 / 73-15) TaxID=644358 RepID=A0A0C4DQK2_MAGP6|nr:hypothetical protein MAPG_02146 [Magnaporthiopsis poae ATCC 64411]